ncbi:MAG: hypothetical protein IH917_05855 [Acidobacteria bacterium]|nr:hypothetical protein [Acidobacteriota bacterium]
MTEQNADKSNQAKSQQEFPPVLNTESEQRIEGEYFFRVSAHEAVGDRVGQGQNQKKQGKEHRIKRKLHRKAELLLFVDEL